VKQCFFCKGPIEEQRIEHVHRWNGRLYILRNVPAEVCSQCGEVFFGPSVLKAMDEVVSHHGKPQEHLSVPVYVL
jgi:YgiT-type zinc finger domain-containing protein